MIIFGQADEEIIQVLFVLVLTPQVVLELSIGFVALVHDALIIGEHVQKVVANFIQSLSMPLELFFLALPKAIPRSPYLELGLEISKALFDELDIEDA